MDLELGQVSCDTYGALSSSLMPKEHILSCAFETILLMTFRKESYRHGSELLNYILHRTGDAAIRPSTMEEHIEKQGRQIQEAISKVAADTLSSIPGVSAEGIPEDPDAIPASIRQPIVESVSEERFTEAIQDFNSGKAPCDQIKDTRLIQETEASSDDCVYVSIDEVGTRQQKNTRKNGGTKSGKVVENTVIHIQSKEGKFLLTAVSMKLAFTQLVAFLLSNRLLENRRLYFFSDGAKNIKSTIDLHFKHLCPYILMLDWYHLEKRVTELLSMALKGSKEDRHMIRSTLDNKLWAGNVDEAIAYIKALDPAYVKNIHRLMEAVEYLERKKPFIPCYALRKKLGLRNSSNPAEKANDIVVADRQKHNGMSWSADGSGALAVITAMFCNGGIESWVKTGTIPFSMVKSADTDLSDTVA